MDIAVNAPVVAQGFQLQSPGLMLIRPKDHNDAVLENGHNIIPVFRVRIGVRTTVRNGPVRRLIKLLY